MLKPVVVTKAVGCADDIVRKFECGYVMKDKDPEEQCYAICDILRDPELAGRMGANRIRATREIFNFEKMAQGFHSAIGRRWQALVADRQKPQKFHTSFACRFVRNLCLSGFDVVDAVYIVFSDADKTVKIPLGTSSNLAGCKYIHVDRPPFRSERSVMTRMN